MNITQESTGDLTATLKVEIFEDDYKERVEEVLRDYRRKANIPGFRPGKVPFGMVRKMYSKSVMAEEINKILSESVDNYLKENKIDILGYPLPNIEKENKLDFDQQTEFDFYLDIGLTPEFELDLSEEFVSDYYTVIASNEMVDNYVKDTRMRNGTPVDGEAVEENDMVKGFIIEIEEDGKEKADGIRNDYAFLLASYIKDDEVKNNFIGLKKGEDVVFNPMMAMGNATEAGSMLGIPKEEAEVLTSNFRFTVNDINRIQPAELDVEFFKKIFPADEIETEEDFREKVREMMSQSFVNDTDKQFMNDAIIKLIARSNIQLPDEFMKKFLLSSNQGKLTAEEIENEYDSYAKTIKWKLIENRLILENDLHVSEEEIHGYIRNYFESEFQHQHDHDHDHDHNHEPASKINEQIEKRIDAVMQNQEEVEKINNHLYDTKLRDLFKSKITLEQKEISYEDFVKLASETKL